METGCESDISIEISQYSEELFMMKVGVLNTCDIVLLRVHIWLDPLNTN